MYISINNELLSQNDANISVSDLSIQRGFGIFDFLKTINNHPVFLEDYLNRFFNSVKEMNMQTWFSRNELSDAIFALINRNNIPNSGIKIILTGGLSTDGYTMEQPNLIIIQTPLNIIENLSKPLKLVSYNHQRQLPHVKTIDYLQAIRLQGFVKENNADELLYHNNGLVRECPRANIFMVNDTEIVTAKNEILGGITRSKVINMNIEGYNIVERDFKIEDIYMANEVFITSSTKNIWPVSAIDGRQIGNGNSEIVKLINDKLLQLIKADEKAALAN
ncbi:aminotransferase class IV [Pedobacter aquatilis]|uniref:aminotransferase class IV n=1 Tax=Pedobacter aquatilis TaxID=351343 RepID=UPI0025B3FE79|nr:aminotransferase class IV [Pedobacter aquatilis]MDN3586931.1 aminotransferase class IV [Pedobacter aquatilis]